jgi:hypothetical protein
VKYSLEDLTPENSAWAVSYPPLWSAFRWEMRHKDYGHYALNDAFYFFRKGWWGSLAVERNYTMGWEPPVSTGVTP